MAGLFLSTLLLLSAGSASLAAPLNKRATAIPDYVLKYAPYVHLWSEESWWPSDIATHIQHVTPQIDYVATGATAKLETLDDLGDNVYLTNNDNVEDDPAWLLSADNRPNDSGASSAPATIIYVQKDAATVDAFYFAFYSYNHGNKVLGTRYGNHVGDWEHIMVRFVNGNPEYIYLSAHDGGKGFKYSALTSTDGRATVYVAGGSHANYVSTGKQDYGAPFGLLSDTTDAGPYWDMTANYRGYWYDTSNGGFSIASGAGTGGAAQEAEGVRWLYFWGHWGDKQYPSSDSRQNCQSGNCHYVDGPDGPVAKNLARTQVCQKDDCEIADSI